jgi:IstB-like ATP binding protein
VITLSCSRALYLEFLFDQSVENFLRRHVHAFEAWSGVPRVTLHDNLRSAVLERRGNQIHFHPRLMELCAHYHCMACLCQVRAGNQKGRVERAIRYVRESFWAGRCFTTLEECNRQALLCRDQVAHQRPRPGDDRRTVAEAFAEEQPRLLPLPAHPLNTDLVLPIRSAKTIYVRFDLNDYSIPPEAVRRQLTLVASDIVVRIDEVGYLSFDDKAADLLYEVINRRYERKPLIVTTNRPFKEWNEVFPNATCVATLLDRLLHHADVTVIEGESYRVRESEREAAARRRKK